MKQPTTVKWLKEVDFAGEDLSLGDLDVALVANLAAGGRVAFRLLNQYVYRHGFDRARLEAHLRVGHTAQAVDSMLALVHFPGLTHLALKPLPAQEPVVRQRPAQAVPVRALPAQAVVAQRATAPAVVRAPTLHDFGMEMIVGEVEVTLRWQFESGPGTGVFVLYDDALQSVIDQARHENKALVLFQCGPIQHHIDLVNMLLSVNRGLVVKVRYAPWQPPEVTPAPPPAPPPSIALPSVRSTHETASAARRATMDELVALHANSKRFSLEHKRLLQDLVSRHGMDTKGLQTWLQEKVGLKNFGARYWMRGVQFDLTCDRGAMHRFVKTLDGNDLMPLLPLNVERVRRDDEAALRSSALHHAGLEKRRVDAALRWGTLQWELQKKRLADSDSDA